MDGSSEEVGGPGSRAGRAEAGLRSLPIAIAALSVEGRCRERNGADRTIFGAMADRFADRFSDPAAGQALLAAAVAEGSAETVAALVTGAGLQCFQIGLWRQRGGERIRILAVAVAVPGDGVEVVAADRAAEERLVRASVPPEPPAAGQSAEGALAWALGAPIRALLARSQDLRAELAALPLAEGEQALAAVSDLRTAGWRLARLAEDCAAALAGEALRPPTPSEVDPMRLLRRICRVLSADFAALGVRIDETDLASAGTGPTVMVDEAQLWTALEALLLELAAVAGTGGRLALASRSGDDGGLAIELAAVAGRSEPMRLAGAQMIGPPALRRPDAGDAVLFLAENGLSVERACGAEGAVVFTVIAPPERRLGQD